MKNLIISIFIFHFSFFIFHSVCAQWGCTCLPEGIHFTTQSQIDSFQVNFPGCTHINGSVRIGFYDIYCDIENLNALSVLTSIGGNLSVSNTLLIDLSGLDNLVEIDSSIWIYANPDLTSIASLSNLSLLGGSVYLGSYVWDLLAGNPSLTSLTGLDGLCTVDNMTVLGNHSLTDLIGLNNLQSINGTLFIAENNLLASLTGLNNISYIGGNAMLGFTGSGGPHGNPALLDLSGLEGLVEIGGNLDIAGSGPASLEGLNNLVGVGGDLIIQDNDLISCLEGLNKLGSVEGKFLLGNYPWAAGYDWIPGGNPHLRSLSGIENLTSVGSDLVISTNELLTSLSGLQNITLIGGDLIIYGNDSLSSLDGLDYIAAGSIENIYIQGNSLLSDCKAEGICTYLASPNGSVDIYNNAGGCNNPPEIAAGCGITSFCLPYGNYHFNSQADIDNFPADYPDCFILQGQTSINGPEIINLNGFSVLTSIGGSIDISHNDLLTDLDGFDNIDRVDGDFEIYFNEALTNIAGLHNISFIGGKLNIGQNDSLTSLAGLESLVSIGGDLSLFGNDWDYLNGLANLKSIGGSLGIGGSIHSLSGLERLTYVGEGLGISHTQYLSDLSGLKGLKSIGGNLHLQLNSSLISLAGLDNIEAGSIGNLVISYNDNLSECALNSVCSYLVSPNGEVEIHNNAPGCNSEQEVEAACLAGVQSLIVSRQTLVDCYPNPTQGIVDLRFHVPRAQPEGTVDDLRWVTLKIYNAQGQLVATLLEGKCEGDKVVRWDMGGLPAGVYFYRLTTDDQRPTTSSGKIVKY